jgi:hypothetical protein
MPSGMNTQRRKGRSTLKLKKQTQISVTSISSGQVNTDVTIESNSEAD